MTHDNEPSYYEVALTNRQVLMAFIVILSAVLGSFLCGVWVGKGGRDTLEAQELHGSGAPQEAKKGEDLESFRFFTDPNKDEEPVRKPDLSRLMDEPKKDTTLAQDVGSQPSRRRTDEPRHNGGAHHKKESPPAPAPPPPAPAPPPPAPAPPPPASPPVTPPAAKAGAAEDGAFIVQVFATHDEEQAKKVRRQVETEGYTAFISPIDQSDGRIYRVRIGPFEERSRAERAARGVKKKLKLEPWVTAASN